MLSDAPLKGSILHLFELAEKLLLRYNSSDSSKVNVLLAD